jgi:membrane protease YdiL (CAAX protease family)
VFTVARVRLYLPGVIVQEFVLNALLLNRLLTLFSRRWMALLTAGVIFSALHWPNPVLVPLTLAAGLIVTWLFARERNLIPLILAHTVLGLLLWWAFPLSWHHALSVGPAYYNFRIETYHTN